MPKKFIYYLEFNKYMSRKIHADVFIDDRNVGGFIGWHNIRKILIPDSPLIIKHKNENSTNKKQSNIFKKLFG